MGILSQCLQVQREINTKVIGVMDIIQPQCLQVQREGKKMEEKLLA